MNILTAAAILFVSIFVLGAFFLTLLAISERNRLAVNNTDETEKLLNGAILAAVASSKRYHNS